MDEEVFKSELIRRAVRDPAFRAALLADPKGSIERELGRPLPDSLAIEVIQESTQKMYLVLPLAIAESEEKRESPATAETSSLSDTSLEQIAGGVPAATLDYRQDGPLNRALSHRSRRD
jgi:hypothetical protein